MILSSLEKIPTTDVVATIVIIAVLIVGRRIFVRGVRGKSEILSKEQRRWITRINNGTWALLLASLFFVWAPQLHAFALSLTAIAAALVLATRELLLCVAGAIMRVSTRSFKIGDWVTIEGVTGEVVNADAFAVTLQQIDRPMETYDYTGRTITVPNSQFLSKNVENLQFFKNRIFRDVVITVQFVELDPQVLFDQLKIVTERYFAPHRDGAAALIRRIERRAGIDMAEAEPEIMLRASDVGHYIFTVRVFVPTREARKIASDITRDFLSFVHAERLKVLAAKEKKDAA